MPSNEFLAVMDAAIDGVILIDHAGRIAAFNRSAERLFGWTAAEVQGRNVSVLMPEPERGAHDAYLARYLQTGIAHIIGVGRELQAQRRDGSCFPIHLSVGRVAGADPPQFVGFVRDITTERQALAALQAERDHAKEAHRSTDRLLHVARLATVGEMAAGIAHELNQPLTAITNYARACERFLQLPEPDLAESRDAVREIGAEALRAGEIIRRLRRMVRADEEARESTTLNDIIEELRVLSLADARTHDTGIRFELASGLPPVLVNRVQITQVLVNLIRNALEALTEVPAGEREITVRTTLAGAGDVEVCVCDNGPGVDPGIADRMFDPFCTTKPNGTGLGLPMSRTIVHAHGGTVSHVPAQPHGACFLVRLPAGEETNEG
jgi:two-component system sensor kinase FixL